jgi:hypothetical protein
MNWIFVFSYFAISIADDVFDPPEVHDTLTEWICEDENDLKNETLYPFRMTLVTYAEPQDSIFARTQKLLNDTAISVGDVDTIITWNLARLQESAYWEYFSGVVEMYPEFLDHTCSYWLWKPWIIRDALRRLEDGDFVVCFLSTFFLHFFLQNAEWLRDTISAAFPPRYNVHSYIQELQCTQTCTLLGLCGRVQVSRDRIPPVGAAARRLARCPRGLNAVR